MNKQVLGCWKQGMELRAFLLLGEYQDACLATGHTKNESLCCLHEIHNRSIHLHGAKLALQDCISICQMTCRWKAFHYWNLHQRVMFIRDSVADPCYIGGAGYGLVV